MYVGQIMALCVALCSAGNSTLYNRVGLHVSSDVMAHLRMWIALPLVVVFTFIADGCFPVGYDFKTYFLIILSGILGFFVTDYFLFYSYVNFGPRETSVVMTLNPIITALLALAVFKERLDGKQVGGILVTIVGIGMMIMGDGQEHEKKEKDSVWVKGLVFAFVAAFFQSLSDITSKFTISEIPSVSANMLRCFGGLASWIIYGLFKQRTFMKDIVVFKEKPAVLMMLVGAVLLGPVLGTSLTLGAMTRIPVGVAKSLIQTSPLFLLPFDIVVRHRKLTALSIVGTVLSVAGVVLLVI